MKRIFKIFAISFVCLCSALTITSCKKHKHSVNENEWAKDSSSHWHACEGCDELFELDIHAYGAFTKDANECKQTRACTVCGFVQTQTVGHTWGAWANRADGSFGKECTHCHTVEHLAQYYVKGAIAGNTGIVWDKSDAGKLSIDATTMVASITLDLAAGDQFKVGTATGWEFNATNITLPEGLEGTDNVEVKVAGNYTITVSKLTEEKHVCAVVLNQGGTDEPATPPVTDEPTQGPTQDPATPPVTDEPTQGPTQDPAPTPGEGDEPSGEPVTTYTVTYNKNGHGVETVQNLSDVSVLPALPTLTETGWTFGGWFYDEELTDPATANDQLTANVTLYAKWTEEVTEPVNNYENLIFNQWGDKYTVVRDEVNKTNRITYENVMDASYVGVTSPIADLVGENNAIKLTLTNNGQNEVNVRYEVGYTQSGALVSTIISATNATYVSSEHNATAVIAAGASLEVTLVFDTTNPIDGLNLFLDSAIWKEEADRVTHAGDVTVSKVEFLEITLPAHTHSFTSSNVETKCSCGESFVHYYVRGSITNNWADPSLPKFLLKVDTENEVASVLVDLKVGDQFKVTGYAGWDLTRGFDTFFPSGTSTDFSKGVGDNDYDNIICKVAGVYKVTVTYGNQLSFSVEKVDDHTHVKAIDASLVKDSTYHWYECKDCANGKVEYVEHNYAGACDSKCNDCNYVRETSANHTYDDNCMGTVCSVCEETRTAPGHTLGAEPVAYQAPTCTEAGKKAHYQCSECEKFFDVNKVEVAESSLIEAALEHSLDTSKWISNEEGHWHKCIRCEYTSDYADHDSTIGGPATTEKPETCDVCQYIITPVIGHTCTFEENADEDFIKTPATCTTVAVYYKSCSCGKKSEETFNGTDVDVNNHNYLAQEAVAATCESTGKNAYFTCKNGCEKVFVEVEDEKVEITNENQNLLIVPANGHNEVLKHVDAVAYTCTTDGSIEYWLCEACNTKFDASENGNKLTEINVPAQHTLVYEEETVTCSECKDVEVTVLYARGGFSGPNWEKNDIYRLTVDPKNPNKQYIKIYLAKNDEFKIASYNWGTEIDFNAFDESNSGLFTASGDNASKPNIKTKTAGVYLLTVTKSGDDYSLNVESSSCVKHVANDTWFTDNTNHWHYCTECKVVIDKVAHNIVNDPATAPTCTEDGLTAGTHCSICEKVIKAQEVDPSTGHDYESVVTDATCLTPGYTTHTCHCGDEYVDSNVGALGHNYKATIVNPTCTEGGYTEHTCSRCSDSYQDAQTTAKGHTEVVVPATAATCTATGLTEGKKCSVCNAVLVAQEEVEATGHTEVIDAAVEATCTTKGLEQGTHCSVCNAVLVAQKEVEIDSDNHNFAGTYYPSTESNGHYQKCTRCEVESAVADHTPGEAATETTAQTCTACGKILVEALGCQHVGKLTHVEPTPATCSGAGTLEHYACECGKKFADSAASTPMESVIDPQKSHTEEILEAVAATCTATGLTEGKKCSVCNTVLVEQTTTNMLSHTMVEDEAVPATCTTTGLTAGSHCSVCGHKEGITETPVLGHNMQDVAGQAPTCTEKGWDAYKKCSRENCDYNEGYVEKPIDKDNHDLSINKPAQTATCTQNGWDAYKQCSRCDYNTKGTITPAYNHPNRVPNYQTGKNECTKCGDASVALSTANYYAIGTFNSWVLDSSKVMYKVENTPNVYRIDLECNAGDKLEFKFLNGKSWNNSYGAGTTINLNELYFGYSGGNNFVITINEDGIYSLFFDFNLFFGGLFDPSTDFMNVECKNTGLCYASDETGWDDNTPLTYKGCVLTCDITISNANPSYKIKHKGTWENAYGNNGSNWVYSTKLTGTYRVEISSLSTIAKYIKIS